MKIKKMISLFVVMTMLLGVCVTVNASEASATSKFEEMLTDMYGNVDGNVRLIGYDGEDVTESFFESTYSLYSAGQWNTIREKFNEDVDYMVRTTVEEAVSNRRNADLVKTEYHEYGDTIYPIEGNGDYSEVGRDLYFRTRASIYYRSDNYQITTCSGPTLEEISIGPGENDYNITRATYSIASNKLSATFTFRIHVWFSDWLYYDYGEIADVYTIWSE